MFKRQLTRAPFVLERTNLLVLVSSESADHVYDQSSFVLRVPPGRVLHVSLVNVAYGLEPQQTAAGSARADYLPTRWLCPNGRLDLVLS